MNPFENPQPLIDQATERDRAHEQIFTTLMIEHLIEGFEEDLYEITKDEDQVAIILDAINAFDADEQKMILSVPQSIRKLRLAALFKKATHNDVFDATILTKELLNNAQEKGYTIGYHTSPYKIVPEGSNWDVNPTGLDDRDNRPMAYYSLDYKNLFHKTRGKYIYMVRAETGTDSTHKKDTSNNWSRANKLSIITSVSLQEIDEKVAELSERKIKKAV